MHRILIFERQPIVAKMIRRYLSTAAYLVEEESDRDILLDKCAAGECDLVLAGLGSLEPTPLDVVRQIIQAEVPLLLMTGGSEQDILERAVALGAYGPLLKPFTSHALLVMVHDILR